MGQIYKDVNQFYGEHQALFWLAAIILGIGYVTWNKMFHRLHFTLFRPIKKATESMTALAVQLENGILAVRRSSRLMLRLEAYSTGFFLITLFLLALAVIVILTPTPLVLFSKSGELVPPPPWSIVDVPVILLFVVVVLLQIFRFKMLRDIEKCMIGDLTKPRLILEKAKAVGVRYVDVKSDQLKGLTKACTRVELLLKEIEQIAEKPLPGEEVPSS
jgi:hypothetical protein